MTSPRRVPMGVRLQRHAPGTQWATRKAQKTDAQDLALLLYAAFHGTVDDEGDTLADAQQEIDKTFSGAYGRWMPDCSFVIEQDDVLASACLVSWYAPTESPFVVFTMTRPEFKRRGMARVLLQASMNALLDAGYDRLSLIVTGGNRPAMKLYAGLGFRPVQER